MQDVDETSDDGDAFLREVARVEDMAAPSPQPLTGYAIGRFRILSELGRGGMGIVYLAHDESLQRAVALKLMRPSLTRQDERQRRFLREARGAASVTHPNLTTIYDVGELEGRVFIAMERLEGKTLRQVLAHGRLPIEEATRIAAQILAGLARAHQAGFVHRDLKPDNVMVTAEGGVKLLDFGLAKQYTAQPGELAPPGEQELGSNPRADSPTLARETAEHQLLGTPGYMSPEQVRGGAIDPRSDIFSFGVLLYEMLGGVRPFLGPSQADLHSATLRDTPRRLGELRADVPSALTRLVERCLEKDPALRYDSCPSIAGELEQLERVAHGAKRVPERRRALAAALALAVFAALLGLARWGARKSDAVEQVSVASPAVSAPAGPIVVTALPLPPSKSPEALAAYQAAMQGTRDGNWGYVTTLLERAVALDPTLAIAHLRLAIYQYGSAPLTRQSRVSFGRALLGRASLNERDQALLNAYEPLYRDPPDRDEAIARLQAATRRYPNDAELFGLLAGEIPDPEESLVAARHSIELDPQSSDGWQFVAVSLFTLGDTDAALRALDRCLANSPATADCRAQRGILYANEGRCAEMEEDFRAALASSRSLIWQDGRAIALFALGRAPEESLEVYQNKWAQVPNDSRKVTELLDRSNLNLALGNFSEAERQTLEGRSLVASDAEGVTHAQLALQLVQIYTETNRLDEAGRVADDYLKRKSVWIRSALVDDRPLAMYWAKLRAKTMTRETFIQSRDTWIHDNTFASLGSMRSLLLAAYAAGVETREEAREALDLFPNVKPLASEGKELTRAMFGRLYVLTGRPAEALPYLQKTVRSCAALSSPVGYVRANLYLGQALEATGDRAAACTAYANVISRWGKATPPSVTASKARARSRALRCDERSKADR